MELINQIPNNFNPNTFFTKYVPVFIVLGVLVLLVTFLGPVGIVLALLAVAALIYEAYRGIIRQ